MAASYHCLNGLLFCSTGLPDSSRDEVISKIQLMRGHYNPAFTQDTTHLIAVTTGSNKYKSNPNFDVLSIMENYHLPPLEGCVVCVTGFPHEQRVEMRAQVETHGGQFSADLVKTCTHLIASAPTGKKHMYALKWNVAVVTSAWLEESVKCRARMNEEEYQCLAQSLQTPEIVAERAPAPSARPMLLFDRCNIYLGDGLTPEELANCRQLIREYGGATAKAIDNLVTHVVGRLTMLDLVNGRAIPIVSHKWLLQCVHDKCLVDVAPFTLNKTDTPVRAPPIVLETLDKTPVEATAVPATKIQIRSNRRITTSSLHLDSLYPLGQPLKSASPLVESKSDKENIISQQRESTNQLTHLGNGSSIKLSDATQDADVAPTLLKHPTPAKEQHLSSRSCASAIQYEDLSTSCPATIVDNNLSIGGPPLLHLLKGYAFSCEGFSNDNEVQMFENEITTKGGIVVRSRVWPATSCSRTRFVLLPLSIYGLSIPPPVDCTFVTEVWLDKWVVERKMPPVRTCRIFQPTTARFPILSFASATLSVTGFDDFDRNMIEIVLNKIGAKFTPQFSKKNTHLLSKSREISAKVERAQRLNVPVLKIDWLFDAVATGEMPAIQQYVYTQAGTVPEFKPRFDTSHAMTALASPALHSGPARQGSMNSPLDSAFANGIRKAKENTSKPLIETPNDLSAPTSSAPFLEATIPDPPPQPSSHLAKILLGITMCVSQKLTHRRSEFYEKCSRMGAVMIPTFSDKCTHYIHQGNRSHDTFKDFKIAKSKNMYIVSPYWVDKCLETGVRQKEADYPHTYNPAKALQPGLESPTPMGHQTVASDDTNDKPTVMTSTTNNSEEGRLQVFAKVDELFSVKGDTTTWRRPRAVGYKPRVIQSKMDVDIAPTQIPAQRFSLDDGVVGYEDTVGSDMKRRLIDSFHENRKKRRTGFEEPSSCGGSDSDVTIVEDNLTRLCQSSGGASRLNEQSTSQT
ncbi:hypothetical protein SeMB42_g01638 [Synchytrium endobioticum]|uniref:BRCT domain-containing protein n=1 Tax=Synchytrium endobioticum TaxID=286115 RepID=A0A507DKG3_9FUNG|nr:hypothetical protein SeMB42_g01638 [Synchytrium endobioticum]